MSHHRSRVLTGTLVVACAMVLGSVAHGSGKSALRVELSSTDVGPDGLPATFRLVISNGSGHEVTGANLCLTFYAGDEFYAWALVDPPGEFALGPRTDLVQVLPFASLVFDGPDGQRRAATEVAARLSRFRWSVEASVIDDTVTDSNGAAVTVRSNELGFSPKATRDTKP